MVHEGRARLFNLGIFGGSNGFWDAATLKVTVAPGNLCPAHRTLTTGPSLCLQNHNRGTCIAKAVGWISIEVDSAVILIPCSAVIAASVKHVALL